jgi:dTDP-4-dehydrorhamnose 3,5-epimerase
VPFLFETRPIPGLILITPRVFEDERGLFFEWYKESDFTNAGIRERFVQDNHSVSRRGVLRGLHYQKAPHAQGKLVRCTYGRVWDAAVDIRADSPARGRWFGTELSAENRKILYIPPGFAHGFLTLSETAEFCYKVSAEYAPEADTGIRWNDGDIGIEWPLQESEIIVSEKDASLPFLRSLKEGKQG